MKKFTLTLFALGILVTNTTFAADPLMVIRFNQPNVYYAQSLFNVVDKAVKIKPSVQFDVVALSSKTGRGSSDLRTERRSRQHAREVMQTLMDIGIPESRLHVSYETFEASKPSDKIKIFVR